MLAAARSMPSPPPADVDGWPASPRDASADADAALGESGLLPAAFRKLHRVGVLAHGIITFSRLFIIFITGCKSQIPPDADDYLFNMSLRRRE